MFIYNMIPSLTRISFLLSLIPCVFLSSCTKNTQVEDDFSSSSKKLEIRIVGVDDAVDLQSSSSKMKNNIEEPIVYKASKGINYSTSYSQSSTYKGDHAKIKLKSSNSSTSVSKQGTAVDLASAVVYRFVLFVKEGSKYSYVGHKDAVQTTSSEVMNFDVINGKTYKWVAYSYNTSAAITDVINATSQTIETSIDKDLLYASNEIVIPEDNENLKIDITFKHRLARIAVTMDAHDFPATIPDSVGLNTISVKLAESNQGYFKKGQLNLLDNRITNLSSVVYSGNLPFVDASNPGGDTTRVAYLYTSDFENVLTDLTLTVNTLTLQDIYTFRDAVYPVVSNANIVVKGANVVARAGYSYSPTVKFSNTVGIVVDNLIWARGNLRYVPNGGDNSYIINKSPNGVVVSANNDYWLYNSLTPWDQDRIDADNEQNRRNWADGYDPCRKVLPLNTWRLPTRAEVLALGGGGETSATTDRLQSEDWNKNSVGKIEWGTRPSVIIPQTLYTSFKGGGNQWVTFFKTGLVSVGFNYNILLSSWDLDVEDSVYIAISDGNPDSNTNYRAMQIDGEQNFFKDNEPNLEDKITVRCVRSVDLAN